MVNHCIVIESHATFKQPLNYFLNQATPFEVIDPILAWFAALSNFRLYSISAIKQ